MLPNAYLHSWATERGHRIADFTAGRTSWIVGLAPELAVGLAGDEVLHLLRERLGPTTLAACLDPALPYPSPVAGQPNGNWLRSCATVGVNVRTIGNFWNVVKYALTLPAHLPGVHLLPIWEPGVVGSLYGMASWQLNPEFYSEEMARLFPSLTNTKKQLTATISILHALGKVVGMDVIPHTDRYSEIVLANPDLFEWIHRRDLTIISHRDWLHEEVQGAITDWLGQRGPALSAYGMVGGLWQLAEADRLKLLFGHPDDFWGRQQRRINLVDWLYHRGLEPAPATMAPPYRGLEVDPDPEAMTIDDAGRIWRDYRITRPTTMSRAFGPLTRYKLYGRKDDNANWEIDFTQPRTWVWDYLTRHYAEQQAQYGFDFMRGDMSHVQMRPTGVPETADAWYDPLRAVKRKIQEQAPHFAYFAESFLAEPGFMAYGDEVAHLERSEAEVTLGNLQSTVPGGAEFWEMTDHYLRIAGSRSVTPAWTVITGDKDDPRFDLFHHHGERARFFTGLFLGWLPLYYSLGFEQRDRHFTRARNEVYSKLYVFQEKRGDKAVSGPFEWGDNLDLFLDLSDLHRFAAATLPDLGPSAVWGAAAGATEVATSKVLAWQRPSASGQGTYLFVVSFDPAPLPTFSLPLPSPAANLKLLFATDGTAPGPVEASANQLAVEALEGGRCYFLG
ncbi:hypothetical protein QWY85_13870 [Neolewinella lacunae]|uniref:Uncharacterized protein n=1 Tax=Neolewinella lacunae TaxID=1517758 RepID=A0A923PJA9_9BACT|nr:hypothetical protein [Neolewinella lacunae]MBC6993726.1 hypothetical protein [Neolewinella lacunae]MDN3635752.1 hypothetical protein [Neolewinella lacunae]